MGSLVDWSAVTPQGGPTPGGELSSVRSMLEAFAQRRAQQQAHAEALAQQQAQFEWQKQEHAADNARADAQMKQTADLQREQMGATEAQRKAAAAEQQRKDLAGAFPQIRDMALTDPTGAQQLAQLHGAEMTPKAPPPPVEPPAWASNPLNVATMGMFPTSEHGGQDVLKQAIQPPPGPTAYELRAPTGRILDIDPAAITKGRQDAAKTRADAFVAQVSPTISGPASAKALKETVAMMQAPTWDPKEDPFKAYQARMQALEGQDLTREGHRRTAATAGAGEGHKQITENQRGLRELRGDFSAWKTENGVRDLGKAYEEMAKAEKMSTSGAGPAQAAAVESFIKSARGGAVTGASQAFMTSHMGGILDTLETRVEAAKKGNYGAGQMGELTKAIRDAKAAIKAGVEERRAAFVDKYYSGEYDAMKANVDNEYAGLFGQFGYKAERHPGTAGITVTGHSYHDRGGAAAPKAASTSKLHDEADALLGGGQ